jgi:hypothetical protein
MRFTKIFVIALITLSMLAGAHSGNVVNVGLGISPTIDGIISTGEWDDASFISIVNGDVSITCYFKHNGADTLYVAQKVGPPNGLLFGDKAFLLFDTDHDAGTAPQADDCWLYRYYYNEFSWMRRIAETRGTGFGWQGDSTFTDPSMDSLHQYGWQTSSGWKAYSTGESWTTATGQSEFAISFSMLGIAPDVTDTIGFMIGFGEFPLWAGSYFYPAADENVPNMWADMVSSDNWTSIDEKSPTQSSDIVVNAFPNPFNSSCEIAMPVGSTLEIFDLNGKVVMKHDVGVQNFEPLPKSHAILWSPDQTIPSGVYLVRSTSSDGQNVTKKVVLVR